MMLRKKLSLKFTHFGDAHLDCPGSGNLTSIIDVLCDPQASTPKASGIQIKGCDWIFQIRTKDDAVCNPKPEMINF